MINEVDKAYLVTIPLWVWCISKDVAKQIKSSFFNGKEEGFDASTGLHYFENISIQCVHSLIDMGREATLIGKFKEHLYVHNNQAPFMD